MDKAVNRQNIGQKVMLQIVFVICGLAVGCGLGKNATLNSSPLPLNVADTSSNDSLLLQNETLDSLSADSLLLQDEFSDSLQMQDEFSDSLSADSLELQNEFSDTISEPKTMRLSPNAVETIVDYFAEDSVEFDITNKKTFLFNNTNLHYEDIELTSYYVIIDFTKSELHAEGIIDSSEILQGKPIFKQGEYEFKCYELDYNFTSKKGLIKNVITQEGEGYLHGRLVKKNSDNTSYIHYGKYTTCNLEHPHFEIDFRKAKVIPSERIITGPLYLRIANIPTFLALPFGMFPNSNKRTNGLLIGNTNSKIMSGSGKGGLGTSPEFGYYLSGVGYYFAIKDRIDFAITADIYMQRAFAIQVVSNYVKRYKYNSDFDVKLSFMPKGEPTTDSFYMSKNINLKWNHRQDRRAHPKNNFSASVDFQTSGFKDNTPTTSYDDAIKAATQSSVSFSTSFKSRYSLGINANVSQNLTTSDLSLDLPQINFNVQQFYPLRKKKRSGKLRWYEEISMQYTVNVRNGMHTKDTILFKDPQEAFKSFNSEINHTIPIKSTIKLFKHISWNNSISMGEAWRIKAVEQSWELDSVIYGRDDTLQKEPIFRGHVNRNTNYGFFAAHNLSYSSDLITDLYGMYIMKKGRVYALRHKLTPKIGFQFRPGSLNNTIKRIYYDSSKMQEVKYWLVSGAYQTSASVNFSLDNKLEMKVRKKKKDEDDEEEFKKITLLESFSISSYYDFLRDSLRLEPISISGRTLIFKQINLNFGCRLDPYSYDDSLGVRTNRTELEANNRLFRLASTAWSVSCGLNLNKNFFKSKNKDNTKENTEEISVYGFKNWNLSVSYSFSYNLDDNIEYYRLHRQDPTLVKYTHRFSNTLNVGGRLPLTDKWALEIRTGYDFMAKNIVNSDFSIERDLHCWTMRFNWRPFGVTRHFEFTFQAKANILKDLNMPINRNMND